jgi:hypothetical protein
MDEEKRSFFIEHLSGQKAETNMLFAILFRIFHLLMKMKHLALSHRDVGKQRCHTGILKALDTKK